MEKSLKNKNYETTSIQSLCIIFLLILEIVGFCIIKDIKIKKYQIFQLMKIENQKYSIVINQEDRKTIYKNVNLYYQNKKYKYKVLKDEKVKINNKTYYQLEMKVPLKETTQEENIVEISVEKEQINCMDIIVDTWGGDKYR